MATLAGFWGPEAIIWSTSGTPARDTLVTVRDADTLVATTLYTDETKAVTTPNPTKTDSRGNLSFFAVPGEYVLDWAGSVEYLPVVVQTHPDDPAGGGGGVTDHGALTGLGDDDHPQYHNNARGDARYYLQAQVDSALAGKANSSHTHPSSQITDFGAAVDARIANVVGTAPANLDTLGELADALNDDANFAATVTTSLAGKQPLDSDLTAIAGLSPADGSVLARVSGAWNSRTASQLKSDLSLTKVDVGLGNVDNTSDAGKPISTATQTALDGKASATHTHVYERMLAALPGAAETSNGHPYQFNGSATPGATDHLLTVVPVIPGKTIVAVRVCNGAVATFSATATPAQCKAFDFDGAGLGTSPDDSTLWGVLGMRRCLFGSSFAAPSSGLAYFGFSFGGFSGVNLPSVRDSFPNALNAALLDGKRMGIFGSSGSGLPSSFNPASYGTTTSWIPFVIVEYA